MANTKNAGSWYVDTQYSSASDDLSAGSSVTVTAIVVSATAANGRIVLADANNAAQTRIDLRVATSGTTELFPLKDTPLNFPSGVRIATLSNCVATVIGTVSGSK
jgi:hypothetical protein